jgi:D-alanyl-D-alanine carboxypeptidase
MKRRLCMIALLVILCNIQVFAGIDTVNLNLLLSSLESNNRFMGSVAIEKSGELLYTKSVGFSNVELGKKSSTASKYFIGSISKVFTSVLVLKAFDEHKLELTETIDKYFPAIKNGDKITINQLLYHRSGIHDFTDDSAYVTWFANPKTESEMISIISNGGSDFTPDSKFNYSNSNYVLLSYILEKSYGKSYKNILEENIINPLKLSSTYLGEKINPDKNECYSYEFDLKWQKMPQTDPSIPMGAGGIVSNPADLSIFINALFDGKLISSKSLALMTTVKDGYCMGIMKKDIDHKVDFWHNGGIDGFSSQLDYFPKDKLSIAITSNGSNYDIDKISNLLFKAATNKPFDIPDFKVFETKPEDLEQYLGSYSSHESSLNPIVLKDGSSLVIQLQGQNLPVEPKGKDSFQIDQQGIIVDFKFSPSEKTLSIKVDGKEMKFTKK